MTYTKKQRKIIRSQLIGAKKYLWDGKGVIGLNENQFICLAIKTHVQKSQSIHGWLITQNMIEQRLGVDESDDLTRTVYEWLVQVAKIPSEQLTGEAVQTYRREWLDHLIKEFAS